MVECCSSKISDPRLVVMQYLSDIAVLRINVRQRVLIRRSESLGDGSAGSINIAHCFLLYRTKLSMAGSHNTYDDCARICRSVECSRMISCDFIDSFGPNRVIIAVDHLHVLVCNIRPCAVAKALLVFCSCFSTFCSFLFAVQEELLFLA